MEPDEQKFRVEAERVDQALGANVKIQISWPLRTEVQDARELLHGAYLDALTKLKIHDR